MRTIALLLALVFIPATMFAAGPAAVAEKKGVSVKEVVAKPTISRLSELPGLPVSSRQYEFLLDRPRISMALAHICDPSLDLYRIEARPDGTTHVDDPSGLAGDMQLVSSAPGRRVYFISGHYEILKMRFNGRMVLDTEYAERRSPEGEVVDSRATSYVKMDSAFVGGLAKMMAFMFPKKVDARIGRFSNSVRSVAVAVHNDPAGMYGRLAATGGFSPEELREFAAMFLKKQEASR